MPRPKIRKPPEVERPRAIDVNDLPIAGLIRKLEQTWQPDGDTFLLPKSVGAGSLKAGAVSGASMQRFRPDWRTPVFASGWSDQGGEVQVQYARDPSGLVKVRGLARFSGTFPGFTTIFTFPSGFRPAENRYEDFPAVIGGVQPTRIQVSPDGRLYTCEVATSLTNTWVTLGAVSFWAEG